MAFTSYSQNFEDVMLWRALKHVEHGCYIDVGAQHPVIDSVSKAFYDRGWRGIHIEPVPQYAELLRSARPDETVLQVALSDTDGQIELKIIPETGLSTAVKAYAQRHQSERHFSHHEISVPTMTLKSALPSIGKQVHWLKIDVEGLETQVLRGWDSETLRPWVMVVEATIPGSSETDYSLWDGIITAANYRFVYFDGLNRFYIAQEHAELAGAFTSPPNVFDDIKLTENSSLCGDLLAAHRAKEEQCAAEYETRIAQAESHAAQCETLMKQTEQQLSSLMSSRSWRATAPLRFIENKLRKLKKHDIAKLAPPEEAVENYPDLSLHAAGIYAELRKAIETNNSNRHKEH